MITTVVLHFGLVATLALAAFVCCRGLRWTEHGHLLWVLVFITLLVPPIIHVPILPANDVGSTEFTPALTGSLDRAADPVFGLDATASWSVPAVVSAGHTWTPVSILLIIWLVGALAYAARTLVLTRRFQRAVRRAAPPPPELEMLVAGLAQDLGVGAGPTVRVVRAAMSPAIWPTVPPTMLLPRALLDTLSESELRAVLLHELVHCQRRDHWVRGLEVVVLCLYWWLPLVWWFRHELRQAEESCCDGRVLREAPGSARTYAEALIKTVAFLGRVDSRPLPRMATGASTTRCLSRRIKMIMQDQSGPRLSRSARWSFGAATLALAMLVPVHASSPQPEPLVAGELPAAVETEPIPLAPGAVLTLDDRAASTGSEPPLTDAERLVLDVTLDLVAAGDLDEALRQINALRGPKSSAVLDLAAGNLAHSAGRLELALKAYDVAARKAPAWARVWQNRALVQVQLGMHEDAAATLDRALSLTPDEAALYGLLGTAQSRLGHVDRAEAAYRTALELDPTSSEWTHGLAQCLSLQGRHMETLQLIDAMLAQRPDERNMMVLRANTLIALGRHAEAAAVLEALDGIGGASPQPLMTLSNHLVNENRLDEAAAFAGGVTDADAESVAGALHTAAALLAHGDPDAAGHVLDRVYAARESLGAADRGSMYRLRAYRAMMIGEVERARVWLERALQLSPQDGEALLLLGQSYYRAGQLDDAADFYGRAATIPGVEAQGLLHLGRVLVEQGDYARGLTMLRRAQRLEPRPGVQQYLHEVQRLIDHHDQPVASDRDPVLLVMDASGAVVFDGGSVDAADAESLVRHLAERGVSRVVIESDARARAGLLIRLIDACRQAGVIVVSVRSADAERVESLRRMPLHVPADGRR